MTPALTLVVGGSFNPPHSGHLRIAIETAEVLRPEVTLFVPCARPPHKPDETLLPFSLRAKMLRAAIADLGPAGCCGFAVSEIENERDGPSYTVDTLAELGAGRPCTRMAFVMGSEDYAKFSSWRQWQKIPELADLVVLPRVLGSARSFEDNTRAFWPAARQFDPPVPGVQKAFALPCGGRVLYLPQPLLGISSSLVRERMLGGRSLDFLVPPGVASLLYEHKSAISALWQGAGFFEANR